MTQLLKSPQISLANCPHKLRNVLEDIVNQVEIRADFSIRHPNYKPLEIPEEARTRLQNIPEEIQQKYLSLQLRSFIYGIYYSGSMQKTLALDSEDNNLALDLENNTFLGVDLDFYHRLDDSNYGEGYFAPGWLIIQENNDGSLVVKKDILKLYIERDRYLQPTEKNSTVGDTVAIKMPKNCVQNGFYVAIGNSRGYLHQESSKLVRIYFNFTPEGAVKVMASLTQKLNAQNIPFDFKVLYNPQDYQRHDSGVLYFAKTDYQLIHQILQQIYQEHQAHFKTEIPLFTLQLAPGLALAEEPDRKFTEKESFGMNRCQIIANGLLEAWYREQALPEAKMQNILEQFTLSGIDLQHTYLNADSKNIYFNIENKSS